MPRTPADLPLPLTSLAAGAHARLIAADLAPGELEYLAALGLCQGCRLRVCRAGDPWIVEVRDTRIGLAESVARQLLVHREPHA
jgi:Fe2+ transport system protein FeoA